MAAGATVFGLEARRAHRDAHAHYPSDPVFATDRSRFVVERGAAWAFAGLGALGVGMLVYAWRAHPDPDAVRVGVGPANGGALVTVGGAL